MVAVKKKSAPKRTTSPRVPAAKPLVSAAMKARFAKHLAAFRAAHGDQLAKWDAAYESLGAILDAEPPLYLAGGYKTAQGFVDAVLPGMKLETVRDYVRVARHFGPDDEKKHGVTRLALLLDYLEARHDGALPTAALNPERIRVTLARKDHPFSTLTSDQMRDAAREAKGRAAKPPKEALDVLALRAAFSRSGLANVALSRSGERWSFGRVEARQFKDLAAALLRAAKTLAR